MKKIFGMRVSHGSIGTLSILVLLYFITQGRWTNAAELKKARVSQVIQDVKLLGANAVPRPASVNDNVGEGTAVRTGVESRAELTFTDLTITRLGANSVFSFKEGTRDINLESGSVLVQVPPNAPAARIKTPAVTAAISGGTGIFGTGPPSKFMVLEGTGTFYPTGHPEEAVTLHGGEMVMMTPDGHITAPAKFDVRQVLATSALIVDFAELANLPLILNVINEQQTQLATENPIPPQQKDSVDIVSERIAASPTPTPTPTPTPGATPTPTPSATPTPSVTPTPSPTVTPTPSPSVTPTPSPSVTPTPSPSATPTPSPSVTPTPSPSVTPTPSPSATPTPTPRGTPTPTPGGTPSKFGTPSVISSPNPYVISSATTISTDPAITTNGVTDFGKIWRGPATDGPLSAFIFGSTSAFDIASGFDTELNGQNSNGGAGFKFTALKLTGDPTVSTTSGEINLGLIAVDSITSGAPGGTLTFAGIRGLLLATQAGPINLGPEISFSGLHDINFYARGSGSDLTLGSAISVHAKIRLFAEGRIQVNGAESATDFRAFSGGDFLAGSGFITATSSIDIHADSNVNFNLRQFPEGANANFSVILDGGNVVNIDARGDQTVFSSADSVQVSAPTINLIGDNPTAVNFSQNGSLTSFIAGTGGIQASTVALGAPKLMLSSQGDINVYGINIPSINGGTSIQGTISAAGAFNSVSDVVTGDLTAGTTVTVGGNLFISKVTAGTTINVAGNLSGFDTARAGGNITAHSVAIPTINAPNGILTVGSGGIRPFVFSASSGPQGAMAQHIINISSIVSPNGIDFSGNQFNGIAGFSAGGLLTINAATITFDPSTGIGFANFNGADAGSFTSGGPASGGDGGTFIVNTTGAITVNSDIEATSGSQSPSTPPSGNGGTVNLNSSGDTVSISSRIQVSSAGSTDTSFPIRRSAQGGNINIQSGKTTGVAINVGSSSQLLSLLAAAAPGPGGKITIVATNAGGGSSNASSSTNTSSINIDNTNGRIAADRGTVQVEHDGDAGSINLNNANIRADVVKVGALGANGTLTIGGGSVNADTILKLYATGSNGQLNFISNVTLSSGTAMHLAANTITIQPSFVVTINGAGGKANIFTNNSNYNFTPGPGYTGPTPNPANGTFGGNGAKDPQPLTSAPGF